MQNSLSPLAVGVMTGLGKGALAALQTVADADIFTVQLQYPPQLDNADGIEEIRDAVRQTGVAITTVFCGFAGESYVDIPTAINCNGLVPEETRAARVERIETISKFASELAVDRIGAHIGFVPNDKSDPRFNGLVETVRGVCDSLAARNQKFALETGQESSETLQNFIEEVARPNLMVNFDPANMILYGTEPPIPATKRLMKWIDGVHCKDGTWPTEKDKLGHEVPFGEGDVAAVEWLQTLIDGGYRGPLTIEREISGPEQMEGIVAAKKLIEDVVQANN